MASVDLRGLTKRFGPLAVVDNVSLKIDHGQLVCLLGPSGCGKTTTLRLIAGFLEPSDGEIHVGERLVSSTARTLPPEQRNMSMIFQSYALWPHMTVTENIVYGLRLRKLDRDTIAKKLRGDPGHHQARGAGAALSRRTLRRTAAARGAGARADRRTAERCCSTSRCPTSTRICARRCGSKSAGLHDEYRYTTVYVTHDQSEAMTTADLIAVMNGGRIDQLGTPEDIYARPESEFVARFIGASNVIKGTALDANHVAFAGATLKVVGAPLTSGQGAVVAIRQHDIGLSTQTPASPENAIKAVVTRQVYLGAARDYMVEVADGTSSARHHADRNQRAKGQRGSG